MSHGAPVSEQEVVTTVFDPLQVLKHKGVREEVEEAKALVAKLKADDEKAERRAAKSARKAANKVYTLCLILWLAGIFILWLVGVLCVWGGGGCSMWAAVSLYTHLSLWATRPCGPENLAHASPGLTRVRYTRMPLMISEMTEISSLSVVFFRRSFLQRLGEGGGRGGG